MLSWDQMLKLANSGQLRNTIVVSDPNGFTWLQTNEDTGSIILIEG